MHSGRSICDSVCTSVSVSVCVSACNYTSGLANCWPLSFSAVTQTNSQTELLGQMPLQVNPWTTITSPWDKRAGRNAPIGNHLWQMPPFWVTHVLGQTPWDKWAWVKVYAWTACRILSSFVFIWFLITVVCVFRCSVWTHEWRVRRWTHILSIYNYLLCC